MTDFSIVDFLGGAVAFAYTIVGAYFCRFWRKTRDELFLSFGLAFWMLAANRVIVSLLGDHDERGTMAYLLRVLAFLLILAAITRKNLLHNSRRTNSEPH